MNKYSESKDRHLLSLTTIVSYGYSPLAYSDCAEKGPYKYFMELERGFVLLAKEVRD
jgi:hypothetical protein